MQSLLKLLAHIAKAFGISSPADNAQASALRKEKQRTSASDPPNTDKVPFKERR